MSANTKIFCVVYGYAEKKKTDTGICLRVFFFITMWILKRVTGIHKEIGDSDAFSRDK